MLIRKCFLSVWVIAAISLVPARAGYAGQLAFEGSVTNDTVTARAGKSVLWRVFTGGPVRYAPVVSGQNVYAGSDDGYLYCLDAASGKVVWKFFGGPSNRKMLGNERMVSVWHVSAGPVVQDGKVYFAAGTWPMLGVFVYCLDALTGKIIWLNDHTDAEWQPMSFRRQNWRGGNKSGVDNDADWSEGVTGKLYGSMPYSVAPKGQCTIKDGRLVVPCGRAVPAYFDLKTGELLRKYTYEPEDRDLLAGSVDRKIKDGQERLASRNETANWEYRAGRTPTAQLATDPTANEILAVTHVVQGYALVLGIGDGRLIDGLLAASDLRVIVIDADARKVDALRCRLDAAGYYGLRATALVDNPTDAGLPPYFASLIVAGDATVAGLDPAFVAKAYAWLRPYGGMACLNAKSVDEVMLRSQAGKPGMEKADVSRNGEFVTVRRTGALPGAGAWSHQYGDAGNTCSTGESLAQAPLGALWYGGAAGDAENITYAIERGGRGVIPLIVGGRLLFEHGATRTITATDVYTGRLLWQWTPPDQEPWVVWPAKAKGKYWASYGCVTLTGRMAATEDAVYVVSGMNVYALDAATGRPLAGFTCGAKDQWESPRVWHDNVFLSSGGRVLALDRHTGRTLWTFTGFGGVLAAGGGKVFCLQTRGAAQGTGAARLVALNVTNGAALWQEELRVGAKTNSQALAYSESHDRLITSMGTFAGQTGKVVPGASQLNLDTAAYGAWTLVLKDAAFTINSPKGLGGLVDLVTGSRLKYADPLTGAEASDGVDRGKSHLVGGCGPALAGETVATFRMDTAAYYDLLNHSGVRNIGGIRPACTAGMIPADGLVCLPNNAICICRYPVYTTLALAHMPDIDTWSYFPGCSPDPITQPIRQVGINFGAPGDRLADDHTLWLEYPMVGGPSPKVDLITEPATPQWFRYHASRVKVGTGLPWVCASGARDLKSVTIRINSPGPYRVREYYAEPIAGDDMALRSSVIEHRNVKAGPDGKVKWSFTGKGYVCGIELTAEEPGRGSE